MLLRKQQNQGPTKLKKKFGQINKKYVEIKQLKKSFDFLSARCRTGSLEIDFEQEAQCLHARCRTGSLEIKL